jgi:hypothetical protein
MYFPFVLSATPDPSMRKALRVPPKAFDRPEKDLSGHAHGKLQRRVLIDQSLGHEVVGTNLVARKQMKELRRELIVRGARDKSSGSGPGRIQGEHCVSNEKHQEAESI